VQNLTLQTILHFEMCVPSGLSRRRTKVSSDVSTPIPVDLNLYDFLLVQLYEGGSVYLVTVLPLKIIWKLAFRT